MPKEGELSFYSHVPIKLELFLGQRFLQRMEECQTVRCARGGREA